MSDQVIPFSDWEPLLPTPRNKAKTYKYTDAVNAWAGGGPFASKVPVVQWTIEHERTCDTCGGDVLPGETTARPIGVGSRSNYHTRCVTTDQWYSWFPWPRAMRDRTMFPSRPRFTEKNIQRGVDEGWVTLLPGMTPTSAVETVQNR